MTEVKHRRCCDSYENQEHEKRCLLKYGIQPSLLEGTKYDEGKPRLDLWSPDALVATSEVLAFGAEKYAEYNWAKGIKYSRVFRALLTHLWQWYRGEELDDETGLNHLAHAMCCLMFLLHYMVNAEQYKQFDNRFNYQQAADKSVLKRSEAPSGDSTADSGKLAGSV